MAAINTLILALSYPTLHSDKPETGSSTTTDIGKTNYSRTHNVRVCLYIAYIAFGSASLYIKTLYFSLTVLALSAAATVANIKMRKLPNSLYLRHASYVCYTVNMFSVQHNHLPLHLQVASELGEKNSNQASRTLTCPGLSK